MVLNGQRAAENISKAARAWLLLANSHIKHFISLLLTTIKMMVVIGIQNSILSELKTNQDQYWLNTQISDTVHWQNIARRIAGPYFHLYSLYFNLFRKILRIASVGDEKHNKRGWPKLVNWVSNNFSCLVGNRSRSDKIHRVVEGKRKLGSLSVMHIYGNRSVVVLLRHKNPLKQLTGVEKNA